MNSVTNPMPLRIDLVSDVVCPWCIIGYKQLEKALSAYGERIALDLHWHPFELNPQMPEEGQDVREHVAEKYGASSEQSRGSRQQLSELGESLGFTFNYAENMRIVNTFRAHQLLHWAADQGLQTELKLALFSAYFTAQQDVNDVAVLVAVAESAGLDGTQAAAVLEDGRYQQQVREDERRWLGEGIQGVPCFVINEQYMVQGAQDASAFERMLDKMLARHAA